MGKPSPSLVSLKEAIRRLPHASSETIARLQEVAREGEPLAALAVLPLVWDSGDWATASGRRSLFVRLFRPISAVRIPVDVRAAAEEAIQQLLGHMSPQVLPGFDLAIRALGRGQWLVDADATGAIWISVPAPRDLKPGRARTGLLGLLASHADGRVREAAVDELAKSPATEALHFLLWRTGDWVAEVRNKALAAVRAQIAMENAATFARLLPLISRLGMLKRIDLWALASNVRALLIGEPGQASLMAALRDGERNLRREACRVLDRLVPAPHKAARDLVRVDKDALVRGWLVAWSERLNAAEPKEAADLRAALSRDSATRVRHQATRAMVTSDDGGAGDRLREALFDRSASLRHLAQFYLRQWDSGIDLAGIYRCALAGGVKPVAPALAGLGETGTPADAAIALSYRAGNARQACAALEAATKLDPAASREAILAALADRRAGVRRKALSLLERRLPATDAEILAAAWAETAYPAVRKTLVDAMLRLPPWPAVLTLLRAAANGTAETSAVAARALDRWRPEHQRAYPPLPPEPSLIEPLDEAFHAARDLLLPVTRERIEMALRQGSTP